MPDEAVAEVSEETEPDSDSLLVTMWIGERAYPLRFYDLSATIGLELRAQAGMRIQDFAQQAIGSLPNIDVDTAGIWAWLSRRQAGEVVDLLSVTEGISYSDAYRLGDNLEEDLSSGEA